MYSFKNKGGSAMRYNLFAGVVFAAAMFLIPLMALNEGIWEQAGATPTSSAPPKAPDMQAELPARQ